MDPPTSSITRLRPVSAHTEPQIMTTVQARASSPKTIEHPADGAGERAQSGISSSGRCRGAGGDGAADEREQGDEHPEARRR